MRIRRIGNYEFRCLGRPLLWGCRSTLSVVVHRGADSSVVSSKLMGECRFTWPFFQEVLAERVKMKNGTVDGYGGGE